MLNHMKSTPLVWSWRTRPNSSQGIPAKASGLIISMAAISPTKSAIVSQKMADRSQLRDALFSAVKTPVCVSSTSRKSLLFLMREVPPEYVVRNASCVIRSAYGLVRNHAPGHDDQGGTEQGDEDDHRITEQRGYR